MHEDPTETINLASQHPEVVRDLQARLESFPQGEVISEPDHKFMWDPDFFGGPEDREPWADVVQD